MEDRLSTLEQHAATLGQHVATITVDLAIVKSNYATKEDVAGLRTEMTAEFGKVRTEMATIEGRLFRRIVTWNTGVMVALMGGVYFIARYVD